MKKILKWTAIVLLIAFIVIQFIRPEKNRSNAASPYAIQNKYPVPQDVAKILEVACNDCHSNNTRYPWYAEIQPVGWWLKGHIDDGKRDLNFDEYLSYPPRRQYKRMEDLVSLVKKDAMPLNSYLWIHKDAKLDDKQKEALFTWANAVRDSMKANYPPDSLIRKAN